MASSSAGGGGKELTEQGVAAMGECIEVLFGVWAALQLAVRRRWGGGDSQAKADQLASYWFTNHPTAELEQEELENVLYDAMDESFNADMEDGSVQEVAKHLMIMHKRCLRHQYSSYIRKLKTKLLGSASCYPE